MQKAIENLKNFSRLRFGFYPTPLEELPKLRAALGKNAPRIFIKRDDWTGFGFGGNKIRKLEFLFAELRREGIETVITTGGERSNHARMTAFVCAKLGIKCVLVLDRKPRPAATENLVPAATFIENLLGAEVHLVDSIAQREARAAEVYENLKKSGEKVYEIPIGGASAVSTLGFVSAMQEISSQIQKLEIEFDHLFFSSSTAGTHAGMLLGAKIFGLRDMRIIGISPEPDAKNVIVSEIERLLDEAGKLLEISTADLKDKIEIDDRFAGAGYCVETAPANAALNLLARTEAVLLDPVYTAKAFAALIEWVEKGRLSAKDNIIFWHTGGQITGFYTNAVTQKKTAGWTANEL